MVDTYCTSCTRWIADTGSAWYCGDCHQPTCSSCGKFDEKDEVLLCPECFLKPGETTQNGKK